MTGLKCSIEQRTVGKQRGCNVRVGRATGMEQQAVVVRPGGELCLESQPIDAAAEQDALREVLDRQPDCRIRRQAPRPDHVSGADLVTPSLRTATPESIPMILGRPTTSW
jgi:hypothetical protein